MKHKEGRGSRVEGQKSDKCRGARVEGFPSILLKNLRSSFENLRTNGGAVEMIGDFPFMLSIVEAFLGSSAEFPLDTRPSTLVERRTR